MKPPIRSFLMLAAASAALASSAAEPTRKLRVLAEAPPAPGEKQVRRMVIRHGQMNPGEMEKGAFLGVETAPAGPALSAQLGLPKHVGLVVRQLVPESPAAAVLQQHDILVKLDDQLLIDSRQFAVLIRNHQPGDEITLTYVRAGKQATAKVKLGEHDVPKLAFDFGPGHGEFFDYLIGGESPFPPAGGVRHVLPLIRREHLAPGHRVPVPPPGVHGTAVGTANSNIVFSDDQGVLELTAKDGKRTLVAKDPKGEQLFSGPIDSPADRERVPASVRSRLEQIEGMKEFSFQVGPDFEEETVSSDLAPTQIAAPLPEGAPAHLSVEHAAF